jgi:PhnB protein
MAATLTPKLAPYLVVNDAEKLIGFLERTLAAQRGLEVRDADGRVRHAELRIEDGLVMLADTPKGRPPFPAMIHLYVPDAKRAFDRLVAEGAAPVREPMDGGDGTLRGGVRDSWGNEWWVSSPLAPK